ncbi:MAG: formate dehydrogenase accessory protein FdhE [Caldimonas sp.]
MTSPSAARLLSPEEIALRAGGEIPFIRFPERSTAFGEREMRLRQLAGGHAMQDYLLFIAALAEAQGKVLNAPIAVELPSDEQIDRAARAGESVLSAMFWKRDPRWTALLRDVLKHAEKALAESPARAAVRALAARDDAWIEAQADRLLAGVMLGLDLGSAPLIAAGLQTYFTHLVIATQAAGVGARLAPFGRTDDETMCPCCGSRPTASVTRIGAAEAGYRYLACSLCSAQWHVVRIKCSNCLSTKGISYQSLSLAGGSLDRVDGDAVDGDARTIGHVEGATTMARAVQVECCGECGHYLKMVHMERDPHVEPIADDLASLTLDLLASEAGDLRHGVNLMLLFGDPDASSDLPDGGGG